MVRAVGQSIIKLAEKPSVFVSIDESESRFFGAVSDFFLEGFSLALRLLDLGLWSYCHWFEVSLSDAETTRKPSLTPRALRWRSSGKARGGEREERESESRI